MEEEEESLKKIIPLRLFLLHAMKHCSRSLLHFAVVSKGRESFSPFFHSNMYESCST